MAIDPIERLGGFQNPGGRRPTTPDDVASIEARIGKPLPAEYAGFMLRQPFGPLEFGLKAWCPNPRGGRIELNGLYDFDYLDHIFRSYNDHLLPMHWLDIADNTACDFVCLELTGENAGKVYYLEHELHDYDPEYDTAAEGVLPNEESYCLLADSFGEFLARLMPIEGGEARPLEGLLPEPPS